MAPAVGACYPEPRPPQRPPPTRPPNLMRRRHRMRTILLCLGLLLTLVPGTARAGDWPGWRGPRGDGISDEKGVPVKWGADDIAWKTPIPGKGHSSPIVSGDRVFLTTCVEEDARRLGG